MIVVRWCRSYNYYRLIKFFLNNYRFVFAIICFWFQIASAGVFLKLMLHTNCLHFQSTIHNLIKCKKKSTNSKSTLPLHVIITSPLKHPSLMPAMLQKTNSSSNNSKKQSKIYSVSVELSMQAAFKARYFLCSFIKIKKVSWSNFCIYWRMKCSSEKMSSSGKREQ